MEQTPGTRFNRRRFLTVAAASFILPPFFPTNASSQSNRPAPSGRIVLGLIGCGGMGNANLDAFLALPDVQVVAACDPDTKHLGDTVKKINEHG